MITGFTETEISKYDYLTNKYAHLFSKEKREPFPMFGFECGEGWYENLAQLLSHIDHYFNQKYKGVPEGFKITQIKEKFGELRFYVEGSDRVIDELITFTENLCGRTCEFCGSNNNIMKSKGWIVTACTSCIDKNKNLMNRKWVKVGN